MHYQDEREFETPQMLPLSGLTAVVPGLFSDPMYRSYELHENETDAMVWVNTLSANSSKSTLLEAGCSWQNGEMCQHTRASKQKYVMCS